MKAFRLLIWLSQLGLSCALPLAGFLLLAVWLRAQLSLGSWVIWVGILLGVLSAVSGFVNSMKAMGRMGREPKQEPPGTAFNDHE